MNHTRCVPWERTGISTVIGITEQWGDPGELQRLLKENQPASALHSAWWKLQVTNLVDGMAEIALAALRRAVPPVVDCTPCSTSGCQCTMHSASNKRRLITEREGRKLSSRGTRLSPLQVSSFQTWPQISGDTVPFNKFWFRVIRRGDLTNETFVEHALQ